MTASVIQVGRAAPKFILDDQNGNRVSLAGLKGQWVVVYFYPKDDTPGCTKEACQFSASLRAFERLDAVILGVSPDDAENHRKFISKFKLRITLLCNPDRKVMGKYGAWGTKILYGKKTVGVIRSTVIIDPQGKIAYRWKSVRADGHAEHVRRKLEELQAG